MNMRGYFAEAVQSLYAARLRTSLALIGIIIGIASVIAMVSVGVIVKEEALRQFKELGTDLLTLEKTGGNIPAIDADNAVAGDIKVSFPAPKPSLDVFKLQTLMDIPAHCSAVSLVAPFSPAGFGDMNCRGRKLGRAVMIGVTEAFLEVNKLSVATGRFLSDFDGQTRFCVIGDGVAKMIMQLGAASVVGEKIRIGNEVFTIIGVLHAVTMGKMRPSDTNLSVFTHISTILRIFKEARITTVMVKIRSGEKPENARRQLEHFFSFGGDTSGIRITSPEDVVAQMEKQMQMYTWLLGVIGSISLFVGGIGVMNVMLVAVSERRREIGIRRALGASRFDIMGQYLVETCLLTQFGGLVGIVVGVICTRIIAYYAGWQFLLSLEALLLGVVVSSLVGLFFGVYPARMAASLDPAVALRAE